jgi:Asp-tRNA(Asn)/Glu-tRNA(Gln) amidotransferase A subunit family amidase
LGLRSFAVAGHVTGFGSRLWLSTHPPETRTAPVLTRLVDNGAVLLGKTIMAEFGYRWVERLALKVAGSGEAHCSCS